MVWGKQQLLDAVADADAVIVRSDIIDAEVISAAKKMKIVFIFIKIVFVIPSLYLLEPDSVPQPFL